MVTKSPVHFLINKGLHRIKALFSVEQKKSSLCDSGFQLILQPPNIEFRDDSCVILPQHTTSDPWGLVKVQLHQCGQCEPKCLLLSAPLGLTVASNLLQWHSSNPALSVFCSPMLTRGFQVCGSLRECVFLCMCVHVRLLVCALAGLGVYK